MVPFLGKQTSLHSYTPPGCNFPPTTSRFFQRTDSQATLLPYRGGSKTASIPGPTKVPRPAFHKSNLPYRLASPRDVPVGNVGAFLFLGGASLKPVGLCFFLEKNATKKKKTVSKKFRWIDLFRWGVATKNVCCKVQQIVRGYFNFHV